MPRPAFPRLVPIQGPNKASSATRTTNKLISFSFQSTKLKILKAGAAPSPNPPSFTRRIA